MRAAGLPGSFRVRRILVPDLRSLVRAARKAGAALAIASAYRSYADQQRVFARWVATSGYSAASAASARPGHSEHQLGTAIDFRGIAGGVPWNARDWAQTPTGAWLAANAWRFGFVMSYPRASKAATCYAYEPWHYRYVGRELAARVHVSGLTLREYLWTQR